MRMDGNSAINAKTEEPTAEGVKVNGLKCENDALHFLHVFHLIHIKRITVLTGMIESMGYEVYFPV